MAKISRRQLMVAGGGAAVALAAGGAWVVAGERAQFTAGLIRYSLKGEPIAPGAAEAFASEYLETNEDPTKVETLMQIQRIIGYGGLEAVMRNRQAYEHFKRRVATAFMLNSTFFHRQSWDEPVEFTGMVRACTNPFARFD